MAALTQAYLTYDLCKTMGWTYDDLVTQPAWWVERCRLMRHAERDAEHRLQHMAQKGAR